MLRVGVMVSGGGTNLQAILDAIDSGQITNTEIVVVVSNNPGAYGLERARSRGIASVCISPKSYGDREAFNEAFLAKLDEYNLDLIVLAGFLVRIPEAVTRKYEGRIINIHPSLIPSFCGVGYYGLRVHEAALARGVKVTGATVNAMEAEGRQFKGVIFFGLMLTKKGPRVLEYNARFGDPEAQVVLPRMKNDLVDVLEACIDGTLDQIELEFEDNAAVCVVLASAGYPEHYEKGYRITGLETFKNREGYYVFHAGSRFDEKGNIVTNGGRVLGVTAKGETLKKARENAYQAVEWIEFENKYMRNDIGKAIDEVEVVI